MNHKIFCTTNNFFRVRDDVLMNDVYFDVTDAGMVTPQYPNGSGDHVRVPNADQVVQAPRHQNVQLLAVVKTLDSLKKL